MASADVTLKLDQPGRIRFAHSPSSAFVFTLIGAGITWLCWRFIADDEFFRVFAVGFSSLFVLVGLFGTFWRLELDIDLNSRKVRIVRGFWPSPKTRHRQLDEADGVWLSMEYRSSGSKSKRKVPWWFVSLKFPDEKKGTRIFTTASEVEGYKKWEYFAGRLQLDAVDRSGEQEQRESYTNLDENLAEKRTENRRSPLRNPNPPAGSEIELLSDRGRKEIMLPALGFNAGLVFLFFFGAVFAALGASVLLAELGILDMNVQGSDVALRIIPPIFVLVGLGIIWLGIKGSYSATIVSVENSQLFTESLAFGKRSGKSAVAIKDIESVSIAGDVRSRGQNGAHITIGNVPIGKRKHRKRENEIVVRTDKKILRFGASLNAAEQTWLENACNYAAVHGQLP